MGKRKKDVIVTAAKIATAGYNDEDQTRVRFYEEWITKSGRYIPVL